MKLFKKHVVTLLFAANAFALPAIWADSAVVGVPASEGDVPMYSDIVQQSSPAKSQPRLDPEAKNILLIVDKSSSQNESFYYDHRGSVASLASFDSKFSLEKQLVSQINALLAEPGGIYSGLRTFGYGDCLNWQSTEQLQAMQEHSEADFTAAATHLDCAGGGTPAELALVAAKRDLQNSSGNKAVLLISDGNFTAEPAVDAVLALKQEYGEQVCVYPIWVGNSNDTEGYNNLKKISSSSCCGFTTKAATLLATDGMAAFMQRVMHDFYAPADSDCDGVDNTLDTCSYTPLLAQTDAAGCWNINPILFATDKSDIVPEHYATLHELARILNNNPGLSVLVKGHTDSVASYQYNMELSARRAHSVQRYLLNLGLTTQQISTEAEGYLTPVMSNQTPEGRQKNRRAEFFIIN